MTPRKVTGIVCAVLLISTILIVGLLYRSNLNESSDLMAQYNKNTQHFDRTDTTTVIEEIKQTESGSGDLLPVINKPNSGNNNIPGIPQSPTSGQGGAVSFIEALDSVHKLFGHAGLKYGVGNNTSLPNGDKVRSDCSGYVSYALYVAGVFPKGYAPPSADFPSATGLVKVSDSIKDLADLQPGDICVMPGHVEVYAGNNRVYNWGSASSAEDKYAGCSGHDNTSCTVDSTGNWYRTLSEITCVLRIE